MIVNISHFPRITQIIFLRIKTSHTLRFPFVGLLIICYLKMHSQSIKIGQRRGEAPPCLSSPFPLQLTLGPTSSTKPFSLPQSPMETFSPLPGAFVVRCHFWALNPLLFNTLLVQQPTFSSVVH